MAHSGAIFEKRCKKNCQQINLSGSFGRLLVFYSFFVENHCLFVHFFFAFICLAYFWDRFQEACGINLQFSLIVEHCWHNVEVILKTLLQMLQNCEISTPLKGNAVFLHIILPVHFWVVFVCLAVWRGFLTDFVGFMRPNAIPFGADF